MVYETFPSIRKHFCSRKCVALAKVKSAYVPCAICGTPVLQRPSRMSRYCSKSCARTGLNLTEANPSLHRDVSGEKNPNWMGGRDAARARAEARTASGGTVGSDRRRLVGPANPQYGREGMVGPANPMWGRRRELSPRWKGGRKQRKDGYVLVVAPEGHPHPADVHKRTGIAYILEHRLVMEGLLGRYLLPEEVVHHIDGDPSNNAPANLRLYASKSEHMRLGHPRRVGGVGRITQRLKERLALPLLDEPGT